MINGPIRVNRTRERQQLCQPVVQQANRKRFATITELLDNLLGKDEAQEYEKLLSHCSRVPPGPTPCQTGVPVGRATARENVQEKSLKAGRELSV